MQRYARDRWRNLQCIVEKNGEDLWDHLIEVSQEYKLPLCLTFLKKAFDSVETEAVVEALLTQGVLPTQCIRVPRELYVQWIQDQDFAMLQRRRHQRKRGVWQGDTISPNLDLDYGL
ncbi:unnamed protein product [Heligmosomoides polygyrus]|uniref:Reverse transcriptase domain-containing protein n=1 Tax=Heligmosomoides polygyrus TaxID=6339 RepID=A0A183GGN4_HELPZ|nr:unnamed protein product [Heligmosomoides polygyrus]